MARTFISPVEVNKVVKVWAGDVIAVAKHNRRTAQVEARNRRTLFMGAPRVKDVNSGPMAAGGGQKRLEV
jgi:hypothetical protein